ncbi:MAG: sel1 repeat family protein [Campylobacter sp.]|nr:sel1 repeat family protein [Campylobacter sp.]
MRKVVIFALLSLFAWCDIFDDGAYAYDNDDFKMAKILWQKACKSGHSGACYSMGVMYETGQGVEQDFKKSSEFYQKACDDNLAEACYYLALNFENGRGVRKNWQKAKELYKKACDGEYQDACEKLKNLH